MEIRAACSPGEVRVALCDATGLRDYAIWRPGAPDQVGDVHCGRVTARVPAMAGAFVRLTDGDGFLPDRAGGITVAVGDHLLVRVVRAPQGGKGPRLAAEGTGGCGRIALVRRGPGAVERFAAACAAATVFIDDAAIAASLRPSLGDRLRLVERAFDDAIESMIADLVAASCPLPGGATLHVWPTPALTALDVDLGAATAARAIKAAAQVAANRAVLPAIARQIRLRSLGGAIVIDFGGLTARRRPILKPALDAALADDPAGPRCLGFTALGLAEIVRPRIHPPLHELLSSAHGRALAALRACEQEALTMPGRRPQLHVAPALAAALEWDGVALADFARRTGHALVPTPDPTLAASTPGWWRCS